MQTTDQVAGEAEARRNLADALEVTAAYSGGTATDLAVLTRANLPMILAALRAQPERGAEEMLTDPVAVHANMLRGVIAKPSVENIVHLYGEDALRRALPLHPAKGEGGGR